MFRDILLHLDTYPQPASEAAIDQAVLFAAGMQSWISALALEIEVPLKSNRVADFLIDLSAQSAAAESKSAQAARAALQHFKAKAAECGILGDAILGKADIYCVGETLAKQARTRDLCIVPAPGEPGAAHSVAEAVVFGSGRPTLLFSEAGGPLPTKRPGTVVVALDGSRSAARALAGALPVLVRATAVRVLTVTGDKSAATRGIGVEVVRHLERHGAAAVVDEVEAGGRNVGLVLEQRVADVGAGLLVMGAYGHSRVREFVLGGATEHMLRNPKTPLLVAH
jgi:nucleotide-binding universal stress UspA family protein